MSMYLPIGSVVKIKQNDKFSFLIAGYHPQKEEGKIYDYFAVIHPTGLINFNQYICFNADSITEVLYKGFCDEECNKLLDEFDQFFSNLKENSNNSIGEK